MFSVFLMMINIIHNRISLTHIISVHSHRGAYTFHLHVSINDIDNHAGLALADRQFVISERI